MKIKDLIFQQIRFLEMLKRLLGPVMGTTMMDTSFVLSFPKEVDIEDEAVVVEEGAEVEGKAYSR